MSEWVLGLATTSDLDRVDRPRRHVEHSAAVCTTSTSRGSDPIPPSTPASPHLNHDVGYSRGSEPKVGHSVLDVSWIGELLHSGEASGALRSDWTDWADQPLNALRTGQTTGTWVSLDTLQALNSLKALRPGSPLRSRWAVEAVEKRRLMADACVFLAVEGYRNLRQRAWYECQTVV